MIFPHISRLFSATILGSAARMVLLGSIGALFSLNLLAWKQTQPPAAVFGALISPWSSTNHETLAYWYWQQGLIDQATDELIVAEQLAGISGRSSSVLGATSFETLRKQWTSEKQNLESALSYWTGLAEKYPNYRDAWITLSSLSYQLGKLNESKEYLARAESLDPYAESVINLKRTLQ